MVDNGYTIKEASKILDCSTQNIYRQKNALISQGYMIQNSTGGFYITDMGINYLKEKLDKGGDISAEVPAKFYRVLKLLQPLGKSVFRFDNSTICSSSLYDAVMVGLSENLDFYETHPDKVSSVISQLKIDVQFRNNSGVASSSKNRAKRRIKRALELFGESAHE